MKRTRNIFDEKHWENANDYFPETKRKVLRNENGSRTVLLKLPPGFVIPPHSHITTEQHFILEGEYINNGKHFPRGSYQLISPREQHGSFESEKGATILVIWDPIKVKNFNNTKITLDDVVDEISKIEHPSIRSSLMDLGIISDLKLTLNKIILIFAFPPAHIPITYTIINSIAETIQELGLYLKYDVREMNEKEIARFEEIEAKSKNR
jgi:hypothetical protein